MARPRERGGVAIARRRPTLDGPEARCLPRVPTASLPADRSAEGFASFPCLDPPPLGRRPALRTREPDSTMRRSLPIHGLNLPIGGLVAIGLILPAAATAARAEDETDGVGIYRQQCAWCHGDAGEGTDDVYPKPLEGNRSVAQLAALIDETMPQDDPETCMDEDARKVAAYIHDAFYSPIAQARNKPARIELARLTVRQYRNAVADLVGSFREPAKLDDREGLHGEYYKSRRVRSSERLIDRIDPELRFDFGEEGPDASMFEPDQFSIRWEGSVRPPETGTYEFAVRTEHSTRLWVNDLEHPLVDAYVKSGDDVEHRGSIALLGGRTYGLRLEFSKAKQGVDDSDKKKEKPKVKATVVLLWKPPGRVIEVVPARALSPEVVPEAFVLEANFPPDDRSVGYERGSSVSKAWDEATTEAAIEAAAYVGAHLDELAGLGRRDRDDRGRDGRSRGTPREPIKVEERTAKLRAFARQFAERAFRLPLGDDEARLYVDRQFEASAMPEEAIKRVVLLVLKSPRFLYQGIGREDGAGVDPHEVASRLAFGLWDSLPDRALREAAASGRLTDRAAVTEQARRMLDDPRARSKVRAFLLQWLKVDQTPDLSKDPERFPGFDEAIASDLRASLELFLEDVVWGERSDFRRLLLSDELYLNGRLAAFYGGDLPADAPFQKVRPAGGERAGVLSHPYLMTSFAYTSTTSPIHRGVFVARSVLGRGLRPPPEAFAPLAPDLHPDLSTRDRTALQTSPAACQSCHDTINPLGFSMEHFDAVGRFREEEKGRAIDASGSYLAPDGSTVAFDGVRGLAAYLAASDEVREAFIQQLFQYLVKQPIRAYGPDRLAELRRTFAAADANIRSLIVEIATDTALAPRPAPELAARDEEP